MPKSRQAHSRPLPDAHVLELAMGDQVLVTGVIYTARDAAHKRLVELAAAGQPLPVDFQGQILYYVGPVSGPPRPGHRRRRAHHRLPHGRLHPHPAGLGPQGHDRQGQTLCRGHRRP